MNQSAIIFGSIALAFFIYITRKGELPVYAGLLLLSPNTGATASVQQQTQSSNTAIVQGTLSALGL